MKFCPPLRSPTRTALAVLALVATPLLPAMKAEKVTEISQYGITWTLEQPAEAGQFITGDWWVIGPVTIKSVSPEPGPSQGDDNVTNKSIYGAASMQEDSSMRNGSMIVEKPSGKQGYDSRLKSYDPALSQSFPLKLAPGQSLISTSSNTEFPAQVMHHAIMWKTEKEGKLALRSGAVLTCLAAIPPTDAFRPPYAGTDKPIFRAADIQWDKLPKLAAPSSTPDWAQMERYLQRPWFDHHATWIFQATGPVENQVNYGREFSRITSMASLMLLLDVPQEKKEKLAYGLIQLGIDSYGLALAGRNWSADGGHWNGRKMPILFASLALGKPEISSVFGRTIFSEDQQIYYGKGWAGQTALYQIVTHTGPKDPHEEKSPDKWDKNDKRSESYRNVVSGGLPGTALAVQLLGAKALWNHDAFFDYYDRWMSKEDPYAKARGKHPRPKGETTTNDEFVTDMWHQYRDKVPAQADGKDHRKWVNSGGGKGGQFVKVQKP